MQNDTITKELAAALEPTRSAIIERVKVQTLARVGMVYEKMIAHGWNLTAAFPTNFNSPKWKQLKEDREFAKHYTRKPEGVEPSGRMFSPEPRVGISDKQKEAKATATGEKYAEELLASYSGKLTVKIRKFAGEREIASVSYKGDSDPWGYSFVKVELANGEAFTLKTQVIVNCSVNGLLFNQFPTRLVG